MNETNTHFSFYQMFFVFGFFVLPLLFLLLYK